MQTASLREQRTYLPALDGLRFFAFLLAFICHMPVHPGHDSFLTFLHEMGWIGVDLFFAIGTFIFVLLFTQEYDRRGTISVKHFLIRRALRIWPAYYIYLGGLLLILALNGSLTTDHLTRSFYMAIFADNIMTAQYDYAPMRLMPLWTVSFEQQCYLVIPLLYLWLFPRLRPRPASAIALALGTIALCWWIRSVIIDIGLPNPFLGLSLQTIYVLPFLRPDTMIAGALAGYLHVTHRIPKWFYRIAFVLGLAILSSLYIIPLQQQNFFEIFNPYLTAGVYPLLAAASFCLLLGIMRPQHPITRFLALRPISYLGRLSYGLYLYHILAMFPSGYPPAPIYKTLADRVGSEWLAHLVVALTLTIILTLASYYLIERPFLRIKERFSFVRSRVI